MNPDWLCPYKNGTLLYLYIQPGARTSGITGLHDGRVKIRILFSVTKKEVEILRGETGRSKDVFVNLPPEKILIYLSTLL